MLVLMSGVFAASGQTPSTRTNSAGGSPPRATPAASDPRAIIAACAAAADDLVATKKLVDALEAENASLNERLATEKQTTHLLTELNATRKSEADALRAALVAKNETIAAKDASIAAQEKLIGELRRKRGSPWRRLGDILIGAAAAVLIK